MRELLRESDVWGEPSGMILASVSFHHRTQEGNRTAWRYVSNVLEEHAVSFFEQHPDFQIFQHEEARSHSAGLTSDYLHAKGIAMTSFLARFQSHSISLGLARAKDL